MKNSVVKGNPYVFFFLLLLSCFCYYVLAYQTARQDTLVVIPLFALLFGCYLFMYRFFSITHFSILIFAGVAFRLLLLFSTPNLSDDVYRFIWDGRLAANGINPYRYLPSEVVQLAPVTGITPALFSLLNSQNYYTVYPPVLQGVFYFVAKLSPVSIEGAILWMKIIIVLFEGGVFLLIIRLLKKMSLPKHYLLLYVLNPLVIIELTGNVHFEGLLIFFVLLALFFSLVNNWIPGAICIGLGIATKLIPFIFLPLIVFQLSTKKAISYLLISGMTVIFSFALLMDISTLQHLFQSANLFIQKFEFNASLYYVVRWIGSSIKGYNIIAMAGPALALIAIVIITLLSRRSLPALRFSFMDKALFIITTWYLFSTTVHPWYLCLPVALSCFTNYRYTFIWSFTAIFSYAAYQHIPVHENLWLTGTGYCVLMGFMLWELKNRNTEKLHSQVIGTNLQ